MPIAAAFVAALVVALIVTPWVRDLAIRLGYLDQPGGRKVHTTPVPRLGGVAIVAGTVAGVITGALLLASEGEQLRTDRPTAFLAGTLVLAAVGLYDDIRGIRPLVKLGAQVAAALAAVALGLSFERLIFPWGTVELGPAGAVLTVIWIVGLMNAINLIDGLDGLASGVILAALLPFAVIAAASGGETVPILAAAAGGATLGFLRYNFAPASVIMGDTGSMFLGYVLAVLAIVLTQQGTQPAHPWVPIIALGVPIADTAWAIVRRLRSGRSILEADRRHIHHRLLGVGLSQRQTMVVLTGVAAVLGGLAMLLALVA